MVGRPIIAAADPRAAAERIVAECRAACPAVIALTLYSRPGCHLCDEMKAVVGASRRTVAARRSTRSTSRPIAELEAQYGLEIPVLLVNGKKAAKYRVAEAQLRRILRRRNRVVCESELRSEDLRSGDRRSSILNPCRCYFAVMMKWPRRFCCQHDFVLVGAERLLPCPC